MLEQLTNTLAFCTYSSKLKNLNPGILKQHEEIIVKCIDQHLNQRLPSGNMKPSTDQETDKLIHWCHGAPGAIHLNALAYKIFKKP